MCVKSPFEKESVSKFSPGIRFPYLHFETGFRRRTRLQNVQLLVYPRCVVRNGRHVSSDLNCGPRCLDETGAQVVA